MPIAYTQVLKEIIDLRELFLRTKLKMENISNPINKHVSNFWTCLFK